jgi:di/tricarboxylate transporter
MWPVVLISIGLLFLLGRLHWEYSFHRLWPVLLIVMGILKVAQSLASTEGHVGS